jgi:hypothetical protein
MFGLRELNPDYARAAFLSVEGIIDVEDALF